MGGPFNAMMPGLPGMGGMPLGNAGLVGSHFLLCSQRLILARIASDDGRSTWEYGHGNADGWRRARHDARHASWRHHASNVGSNERRLFRSD